MARASRSLDLQTLYQHIRSLLNSLELPHAHYAAQEELQYEEDFPVYEEEFEEGSSSSHNRPVDFGGSQSSVRTSSGSREESEGIQAVMTEAPPVLLSQPEPIEEEESDEEVSLSMNDVDDILNGRNLSEIRQKLEEAKIRGNEKGQKALLRDVNSEESVASATHIVHYERIDEEGDNEAPVDAVIETAGYRAAHGESYDFNNYVDTFYQPAVVEVGYTIYGSSGDDEVQVTLKE